MATRQSVRRGIEEAAIGRVLEHLYRERRAGRLLFPLTELCEATALDPNTANSAMRTLEDTGPFDVSRLSGSEIRWRVQGCVYDLDGWESDVWNVGGSSSR